jgi:hypothetical protein
MRLYLVTYDGLNDEAERKLMETLGLKIGGGSILNLCSQTWLAHTSLSAWELGKLIISEIDPDRRAEDKLVIAEIPDSPHIAWHGPIQQELGFILHPAVLPPPISEG